jgi:hypothetical protein
MYTLPALVPEGEFRRSEVVAVRIARKLAPLLGVGWQHTPFACTWVCDFGTLTLAEIARGAPLPTREQQLTLDTATAQADDTSADTDDDDTADRAGRDRAAGDVGGDGEKSSWDWVGRAVQAPGRSPLPATLANATLNRFGPNTKAAVVLTGANRLLGGASEAITDVCGHLNAAAISPKLRLAVWAGLVLEAFRAQPALVVAAIQARAVQRSLTTRWGSQVALAGLAATSARCEIGAGARADPPDGETREGRQTREGGDGEGGDPWQPRRLRLIDDTLDALDLCTANGSPIGPDRRADIAAAWCRRLLQMGRPGSGMVWLSQDPHGHRTAHSYQRVGAMVAPFVAEVLDTAAAPPVPPASPESPESAESAGSAQVRLPAWPSAPALGAANATSVRAHAVAAHIAVNYLRYLEEPAPDFRSLREDTRAYIEQCATATTARLGTEDPASLLLCGYAEYLTVWDQARSGGQDAAALLPGVEALLAGQRRTLAARQAQRIDPGAASYLLEIGNVALGRVRDRVTAAVPGLDRSLARFWRESLTSRGVDPRPAAHLEDLNHSQIFHLANYAEYLAAGDTATDLRQALRIFEAVTTVREQVAADEPAALTAKHASVRDAHQAAAHVAARLARAVPDRERTARTAAWAAAARHALAVLADPSLQELNAGTRRDMAGVWTATQLEPALSYLLDTDPGALGQRLRPAALLLLDRALAQLRENAEDQSDPARTTRLQRLGERLQPPGHAQLLQVAR